MPDLKSALQSAGLISERALQESRAEQILLDEANTQKLGKAEKERERRMSILRETTVPANFRKEARKLLLQEPELVQFIINLAHDRGMKKRSNGGAALIANLYQLREALSKEPRAEDKCRVVDKNFGKH